MNIDFKLETITGSTEEHVVKARTTKQDDDNMVIALFVEEGNIHDHYQHFTGIVHVTPKGNGSLVKWTLEYEKHDDKFPDPHQFLELCDKVTEKIDAHVHKVDKWLYVFSVAKDMFGVYEL